MEVVEGRVTIGAGDDHPKEPPSFAGVDAFVGDLDRIGEVHDCTIQAFDARYVAGRTHLERALDRADRARDRGETIARERGVEVLLYAAGRRQIDRALEMGVGEGTQPVVVLVAAEREGGDADRTKADERAAAGAVTELVEPVETLDERDDDRLRAFFGISDAELAATSAGLDALVGERVALLAVEK